MRITNSMLVRNMMGNLNKNLRRMEKFQKQYQSGKLFQLPSENPVGVSKSLKLYTDKSKIEQYKNNLGDAMSWMYTTEDAVTHLGEVLNRTRYLVGDAANGTKNKDDLEMIKKEITELKNQVIQIANTTHAGRSIFTGFKTDKDLLNENGEYVIDLKNDEVSKYNVGVSENISINTLGMRVFGTIAGTTTDIDGTVIVDSSNADYSTEVDGTNKDSYLFAMFNSIEKYLEKEDFGALSNTLGTVDDAINNVLEVRAEIGAKTNRLEMTQKRLESDTLNFTRLLSENEDADIAEVIMNFKMAESVYLASMSAGARIIQPSLVDFLR